MAPGWARDELIVASGGDIAPRLHNARHVQMDIMCKGVRFGACVFRSGDLERSRSIKRPRVAVLKGGLDDHVNRWALERQRTAFREARQALMEPIEPRWLGRQEGFVARPSPSCRDRRPNADGRHRGDWGND